MQREIRPCGDVGAYGGGGEERADGSKVVEPGENRLELPEDRLDNEAKTESSSWLGRSVQ